jgi:hypothetical protein
VACLGYNLRDAASSQEEIRSDVDRVFQAASIQRKSNGACRTCRASKSRCSRDRPSCLGCIKKGSDCLYDVRSGGSSVSAAAPESGLKSMDAPYFPSAVLPINSTNSESTSSLSILDDDTRMFSSLYDPLLPKDLNLIRCLVNAYFDRVHHLGCLGFIHQPTFLLSLDRGTFMHEYGEALINVVCALGAISLVAKRSRASLSTMRTQDTPGQLWTKRACSIRRFIILWPLSWFVNIIY